MSPDGQRAIVALTDPSRRPSSLVGEVNLSAGAPRLEHIVPLPPPALAGAAGQQALFGAAQTADGRLVVIAAGNGSVVVDPARLDAANGSPVVGILSPPALPVGVSQPGTVEVAVSADDRYAAETEETAERVTIFDLSAARAAGFAGPITAAQVTVDPGPTGLSFSKDGTSLFVVSQTKRGTSAGGRPVDGTLSVVDVAAVMRHDNRPIKATVDAGCDPVRVVVSHDGHTAWVTDRGANALAAFDVDRLVKDPRHALRGWVRVGSEPVGIAFADRDKQVIVANSNRFKAPRQPSTLSLVDAESVRGRHGNLLATIQAGGFPRDIAATPDGHTVLVSDYGTSQLTVVHP